MSNQTTTYPTLQASCPEVFAAWSVAYCKFETGAEMTMAELVMARNHAEAFLPARDRRQVVKQVNEQLRLKTCALFNIPAASAAVNPLRKTA